MCFTCAGHRRPIKVPRVLTGAVDVTAGVVVSGETFARYGRVEVVGCVIRCKRYETFGGFVARYY